MSDACFILVMLSLVQEYVQEPWNSVSPKLLDSVIL